MTVISKTPTVTVLMTVYNGLPYLTEAVESILNQTYDNFEFVIIDDASTDGSLDYLLSCTDPRIRVIRNNRNLGQIPSLNRGLTESHGAYVARMDQDDVSLPGRLSAQVRFLNERPDVAVVGSWAYRINGVGKRTGDWCPSMEDRGEFLGSLLIGRCLLLHPSVMFRKYLIAGIGGYDPSYAPAEDYELWTRVARRGQSAWVLQQPLLLFRVHEGAQTVTRSEIQRRQFRLAHHQLVASFRDDPQLRWLSTLLRMDGSFWQEPRSRSAIMHGMESLDLLFAGIRERLSFNGDEYASLRRTISRRLGFGPAIARRLAWAPSRLFCAVFLLGSPLLIPGVLQRVRQTAWAVRRMVCAAWFR